MWRESAQHADISVQMRRDSRNRTGTRGTALRHRARHRGASYPLIGDVELRKKGPYRDMSGPSWCCVGVALVFSGEQNPPKTPYARLPQVPVTGDTKWRFCSAESLDSKAGGRFRSVINVIHRKPLA